jgi:hypothetical protein
VKFTSGDIHKLIKCWSRPKGKSGGEPSFDVTVILHNGQIYNDIQEDLFADQNKEDPNVISTQTLTYLGHDRADHHIPGDIVRTT